MSEKKEPVPKSRRKSQIRAVTKYVKDNYDRVVLNLHKGIKDEWIAEANKRGYKDLAPFIRYCVETVINSNDSSLAESYKNDILSDN